MRVRPPRVAAALQARAVLGGGADETGPRALEFRVSPLENLLFLSIGVSFDLSASQIVGETERESGTKQLCNRQTYRVLASCKHHRESLSVGEVNTFPDDFFSWSRPLADSVDEIDHLRWGAGLELGRYLLLQPGFTDRTRQAAGSPARSFRCRDLSCHVARAYLVDERNRHLVLRGLHLSDHPLVRSVVLVDLKEH